MLLVMPKPLAALGDGWNVRAWNPPQTVMRLLHFLIPFGPVTKHIQVIRFVDKIAKRLDGFPDGHVHDHKWIVVVDDISGIPRRGLQPPDETWSGIRQGVYRIELRHKVGNFWIVNGGNQAANVDLRKVMCHRASLCPNGIVLVNKL